MTQRRILIVGGSTRAAADSVRRAGWRPICADLFADYDSRMTAEVIPVQRYPNSLPDDICHVEADGWFYCGAIENHPEVIEKISQNQLHCGPLLGCSADAVKWLRDPFQLARCQRAMNLPVLEMIDSQSPPDPDGTWLQKPMASAGGRLIRVWDAAATLSPMAESHYFQRRVAGIGFSCLIRVDSGQVHWCGAAMEIECEPGTSGPTPFTYRGSIGPLQICDRSESDLLNCLRLGRLPATVQQQAIQFAEFLIKHSPGIRGLLGLDYLCDGRSIWLIEVNPRFTASAELVELATAKSILNPAIGSSVLSSHDTCRFFAKQILYASESIKIPDLTRYWMGENPWQAPEVADIPLPESWVEVGWPICTVMARGSTIEEINRRLADKVALIRDAIHDG